MLSIKRSILAVAMTAFSVSTMPSVVSAELPAPLTQEDVVEIVRGYISNNTGEVIEMLNSHMAEERIANEQSENEKYTRLIEENRDNLLNVETASVFGDNSADVSVVYFQDFNCGYCKSMYDAVSTSLDEEGVRLINRYLPILGESSMEAATLALTLNEIAPEHLPDLHQYLYETSEPLTSDDFHDFITGTLDQDTVMQVSGFMDDPSNMDSIRSVIDYNLELAESMDIRGTPFFALMTDSNTIAIPGATDKETFIGSVENIRGM